LIDVRYAPIRTKFGEFGGKKMIFTTNLDDCRNIDAALLRRERCFDVLQLFQTDDSAG
jgi:hypothetical protein